MSQGRLVLILGGARGGKSDFAEDLAAEAGGEVLYIATAEAGDEEMRARIAAHQAARPSTWRTLEAPVEVAHALASTPVPSAALLDCLTMLVSNQLTRLAGEDPYADGTYDAVRAALRADVEALLDWHRSSGASLIVVSNEVGMGLVPPYPLGRAYRDLLGWANRLVARRADEVYLVVAGLPVEIKALARREAAWELADG